MKYTIDHFFSKVIENYGDLPSVANVGQTPITYRQFGERVRIFQEQLKALGVKKGDHVAIMGYSNVNWTIAFLAVVTMGAVAVNILEEFPEADVNHIIQHSESKGIIISSSLYESLDVPNFSHLDFIVSMDNFAIIKAPEKSRNVLNQIAELPDQIMKSIKKKNFFSDTDVHTIDIDEEDIALIVYTSGTTGFSKGVMLTHKNLVSNAFEGPDILGVINEKSVVLHFLPLAHTFGLTSGFLSIIYKGATIYFLGKKPVPKILLKAMQDIRPTIIGAVPLIFEKIFHKQVLPQISNHKFLKHIYKNNPGRKLLYRLIGAKIRKAFGGRLQCAIIGGAKLNPEVELFLREGKIPYSVGYGLTECSPLVTFSSMEESKMGSPGHAISDVEIRIHEPDPDTGIGEIWVRGPNVMKGYYKNSSLTQEVITEDGWFKTGDLGYLDEDGFLFITGRAKNVIIGPSGENVYPETIEEKFQESLFVEEVLVQEMEGKIIARIYPDYGYIESVLNTSDENQLKLEIQQLFEQLKKEVNSQLPPFARIHKIIIHSEPFSKTPTNKIKRYEYR
jgi:long-chain acyl-CoA synthetase